MGTVESPRHTVRLTAENVGGIDETAVELRPGVNVLSGQNATNRTSLIRAIMAALGSDRVSLKGDADEGRATLTVGETTYARTLARRDGQVVLGGEPFTDDPEVADLFAFLLETNEARQAVRGGDDLRSIIMRPVDTEAIRAEIDRFESEKRELDAKLEQREELTAELPSLRDERETLEADLREKREALAAKRDELEAADAEVEAKQRVEAELEAQMAELRDKRSKREDLRFELETERETLAELRAELAQVEAELETVDEPPADETERLEERLAELRERKAALDSKVNQLQALIQFNEAALEGEQLDGLDVLRTDSPGEVTSRLLSDADSFVCWTCGTETRREDVEEMLTELRDGRRALVEERNAVADDIEETTERKEALTQRRRRHSRLTRRRDALEEEIASAEAEIASREAARDDLDAAIEAVTERVESLRAAEYDEVIDRHKEVNELEVAIEGLAADLERTTAELSSVRERVDAMDDLEERRADVRSRLEDARTRIERLENSAVEAFNDQMETVLDVLEYDNVERIWIERTEREVREGRRTEVRPVFDLHVVRRTESGTVYRDSVDHLSESEREVTGLVFALAGYLAHDVYEAMPFVLLDSIEALDADRIASLVDYLNDYAGYLVVALLTEDARVVDEDHHRITSI